MKTVFFDLGNVIIFFNQKRMIEQIANCTKLSLEIVQHEIFVEKILDRYETGQMSSLKVYSHFLALSPKDFSFEDFFRATTEIFHPNEAIVPLIHRLKEKGVYLVLLSNTNEGHFKYISAHYPVISLFDHLILSYEVGACKPNPLIFQKALERVKGKAFYTDDIPLFIQAAKNAGLDAEVFTDTLSLEGHLKERNFL